MHSARSVRILARFASAALASFVLLSFVAVGASPARAQTPEPTAEASPPPPPQEPTVEDYSKPMGPPDSYNRGTPRGSMYGFIVAARKGDFAAAAEYLDLRRLPPEEQAKGPAIARQLKAVLDQTLWIDFKTLSDSNEGYADDGLPEWQDRLGDIETTEGIVTLLMQRVPREGDKVRIWKVSSATVARTAELYAEFGPAWIEGWLPPVFIEVVILGLALWQWAGLVLLAFVGWLVSLLFAGTIVRILGYLFTRRGGSLDDRIVRVVSGPVRLAMTVAVFSFGQRYLALDVPVLQALRLAERLLWVVSFAWLTFRVIDIVVLGIRVRAERNNNLGLVPVLVPIQRIGKLVIVLIGVLGVLGTLGVNISAAVAGLGVGGIAVALAAQKSLENLFGGITLFADRPVKVGDFCVYGGQRGTVEEIGLRSTRIRTLDRTIVTVPNAEFSNLQLENFAKRDRMRLWTMLGVRYETTPEQLRYLLARLREILLAHPRVTEDPARVRFVGFGAYSLDIEIFAYVDTPDWSEFLSIREDIYLLFMEAVKEAGTGFAFPSSTTYVARDDGLSRDAVERAEQRVATWREKGELPFPNFPDGFREERLNTLDWPPPGSPGAPRK